MLISNPPLDDLKPLQLYVELRKHFPVLVVKAGYAPYYSQSAGAKRCEEHMRTKPAAAAGLPRAG